MARKVSLLRTLLFSLGISGALAFGTSTALAGTASSTCGPPAVYSCLTWYDCKKTCERYGFSGLEAHCMDGCCYCEVT
jgi:hypothetical protein